MVRRCWVNFQCRGVLQIWIIVGQGPTALAVGAGGDCSEFFSLICHCSPLSPSLWETARYRLKYCLKGPLNPIQSTNHVVTPTLTQQYFFLTHPLKIPPHLLINDWSHRSCSFLNILLFKILPESCLVKRLFLTQLITAV